MKILVYIQQEQGNINPASLEALKGAQEIAKEQSGSIYAITFNTQSANLLSVTIPNGA